MPDTCRVGFDREAAKQTTVILGLVRALHFRRLNPKGVILGLVPRTHQAANSDRQMMSLLPDRTTRLSFRIAEKWVLGTHRPSPRAGKPEDDIRVCANVRNFRERATSEAVAWQRQQPRIEVAPMGVLALDKVYLPIAPVALQRFFPLDGCVDVVEEPEGSDHGSDPLTLTRPRPPAGRR